ncbi:hypothetical protein F0L17_07050 [Streptomyces sp. TRM43335]|uniref:Uncharacterized protein n=1 Tax=Streptomyces taklimakanensis TaxID=2569853 RepID=A0A6G2B9I7_9ACTN|nr:hypothetical protein [Streptomyces taklimakanensis]MTE18894.1 hypothetical protein [Streptomyces taklimakanensis]
MSATRITGLPRRVATWTWLEATEVGRMAFLLIAPPAPLSWGSTAQEVERRMLRLATLLGLDEANRPLVYVGPCVTLPADRSDTRSGPTVRLGECGAGLRARACREWTDFARAGGPVALLVGLDPLAPDSPPDGVEEYLRTRTALGRLWMGTTAAV